MMLALYAEPSGTATPGHIVIGREPDAAPSSYFGYRFDPDDLPLEYRSPEKFRSYLFDHTVPGNVEDETARVRHLLRSKPSPIFGKSEACETDLLVEIPTPEKRLHYALYSFNPDDFHTESRPCYNCVTWATEIANRLIPGMLAPVRQGRIKLVLLQLHRISDEEAAHANG